MSGRAPKHNKEKTRLELVPVKPIAEVADTYTFGTCKYYEESWRKGFPVKDLIGAAKRHLDELALGIDIDEDSGCLVAAQVVWNMFSYLSQMLEGQFHLDNRFISEELADSDLRITSKESLEFQRRYFKEKCDHYRSLKNKEKE